MESVVDQVCPSDNELLWLKASDYGNRVLKEFYRAAFYPATAFEAHQAGTVSLCLKIGRNGHLRNALIRRGSGFPVLDGAALFTFGVAEANELLPRMPDDLAPGADPVWFAVDINYSSPDFPAPPAPASTDLDKPCRNQRVSAIASEASSDLDAYVRDLYGALRRELQYPRAAVYEGHAGKTTVCIALDSQSKLVDAAIAEASGSPLLDGAALTALGLISIKSEIPPLPESLRPGAKPRVLMWPLLWMLTTHSTWSETDQTGARTPRR